MWLWKKFKKLCIWLWKNFAQKDFNGFAALVFVAFGLYGYVYLLTKSTASVWIASSILLIYSILLTSYLIAREFLLRKALFASGSWFKDSKDLSEHEARLSANYDRIKGTLTFWKSGASAHKTLHNAQVLWGAITGVLLSVLIPISKGEAQVEANIFLTLLATWNVVLLTLSFVFSAREKYHGFRQAESDFYDSSRDLLNTAKKGDGNLEQKVDEYIELVKQIRKTGRRVEIGAPPSARDR
jgi:hypothetical protein